MEGTEQASEPDIAGRLELSGQVKTTMINMTRALKDKKDSMQEQMDHVIRDKNPKKKTKKKY